jgi:hypothetical protein
VLFYTPRAYCLLACSSASVANTTRNCPEPSWTLIYIAAERKRVTGNIYHVIAIQPVYWRLGRIYRKHSFLYCCVLDHVYRAVAWQCVDQVRSWFRRLKSITVTALSKAWNAFARPNAGIVGSKPIQCKMSLCVYFVFVLSCAGSGLATEWSTVQRVLPTVLD